MFVAIQVDWVVFEEVSPLENHFRVFTIDFTRGKPKLLSKIVTTLKLPLFSYKILTQNSAPIGAQI